MSGCVVQQSGSIELLFYEELAGAQRTVLQEHVARCADCRRALEDLRIIRSALAARPEVSAPPGGDWAPFMSRLSESIDREGSRVPAAVVPIDQGRRGSRRSVTGVAGYLAMAALLVLVTVSVAYLAQARYSGRDADLALTPGASDVRARPWSADAGFASLSEQHFQRSKLVVLGLVNKDPGTAEDWAYERELAASLLSDTRLYRQAAEERGLTRIARVMDDLELVLLQTSAVEEPGPQTLEQIQRLIDKRDLVTKMNVVTTIAGM